MSRPRGLFVTGTDTGVGKTVIACALAAWYRAQGCDVGVMKPVATGGRWHRDGGRSRWVSEDARRLARAAGARDPWTLVNPVCFREPIAPWAAARRARRPIHLPPLLRAFRRLAARHPLVIVEGIGGLMVPLNATTTVSDLAARLGLPLVLVARPGLGTLNHTLLSLRYARARGLTVCAVVLNHAQPCRRDRDGRLVERTNVAALRQLAGAPILGPLPFQPRAVARLSGD